METPSHSTMMAFTYNLFISPLFDLISTMVTSCIYDRTYNASFHQKRDSITDIIRGTSKEKLCNDLGLETFEKKKDGNSCFLRFFDTNVQSTYSMLFPRLWVPATQEILIIFLYSN